MEMFTAEFLSIQAQDFIEDLKWADCVPWARQFLSIQAQDFIEELAKEGTYGKAIDIPEHSSSGLH